MENHRKERLMENVVKVLAVICAILILVGAAMLIYRFVNDINDISNTIYGMKADESTYTEESVICTVVGLSTIDAVKQGVDYAGVYIDGAFANGYTLSSNKTVYYYIEVTDEKSEQHKFRVSLALYETLSENDTVNIIVVNQDRNDGTPIDTRFYCNDYPITYIY